MVQIVLQINGKTRTVDGPDADEPLLYVLRNDMHLTGAKFGCGLGQCGSCTVLIDGEPVRSCAVPASAVKGKIITIEGLGTPEKPHKVQSAFIEQQAAQCGYCTNGMIMSAVGLLTKSKSPSSVEVRESLANNLCRCGTHDRIVKAVLKAARA